MGNKKNVKIKKKKTFHGNQHTKAKNSKTNSDLCSASKRKLTSGVNFAQESSSTDTCRPTGNCIIDLELMISELVKCLRCVFGGSINIAINNISGLGCKFGIVCEVCGEVGTFYYSPMLGSKNNSCSINKRAVYAMRCVGQGLAGLKVFCGLMNMRPPVQKPTYNIINSHINIASKVVKSESMSNAISNEISLSNSTDLSTSHDASWMTRGHGSQHGVCKVIGTKSGQVVDTKVLSVHCKACEVWKGKENSREYAECWKQHESECSINHKGTSGRMEVEGMKKIFARSVSKHGVRYINYIGDGDTKSYKHSNTLSLAVMETIKPVFKNLVKTELISRCLGSYTQNPNESLHSKIWKVCPKTGFCGKTVVKIATNDAIITFNDGMTGRLKVLKQMDISPGIFCEFAMNMGDTCRIRSAEKRALMCTKEARKCRKRLKLDAAAKKSAEEGTSYIPGGF